jgi:hypothetical protein
MSKRPAKFCSLRCRNRGRGSRPQPTPEQRRAWRENRLTQVGYRERNNAQANDRARALKKWIADYKTAAGCTDCGYNAHPAALDVDHMNGKTSNISSLKSIAAVEAEIARHECVVRCANCHRVKSWETRTWDRRQSDSTAS